MVVYFYIIIALLLVSGFFSGMETALIGSNKLRIELDKKKGLFVSRIINVFLVNPVVCSVTLLIGKIITLSVFGIYIINVSKIIMNGIIVSEFMLIIFQILVTSVLFLVVAEFIPKTITRVSPNFFLNIGAIPLFILYIGLYPVSFLISGLSGFFYKNDVTGSTSNKNDNVFSKMDLYHFVAGHIDNVQDHETSSDEIKLFQNALEFSSVRVRDCMIPRTEIVAVEINSSLENLKQKIFETGFSKILVYENDFDNIIGYFTSKDLFKRPKNIKSFLIPISFVPEAMQASTLLHKLIQEHKSISIVVDEFGGISGLISVEDIIEEIFGEIEDEHDNQDLIEKKINENEFVFSGRSEIEDINEKYNLNIIESEDYDTLAGFIFYHYQNFPKVNERITIGPFEFKIIKVSKTRIELVHLKILTK